MSKPESIVLTRKPLIEVNLIDILHMENLNKTQAKFVFPEKYKTPGALYDHLWSVFEKHSPELEALYEKVAEPSPVELILYCDELFYSLKKAEEKEQRKLERANKILEQAKKTVEAAQSQAAEKTSKKK